MGVYEYSLHVHNINNMYVYQFNGVGDFKSSPGILRVTCDTTPTRDTITIGGGRNWTGKTMKKAMAKQCSNGSLRSAQ